MEELWNGWEQEQVENEAIDWQEEQEFLDKMEMITRAE